MALEGAIHIGPGTRDRVTTKKVFFTGSDALRAGYAVCYDRDNATATNASGTTLTLAYESYARHRFVEKPSTSNVRWFAGIVTQDYPANSNGQYINIVVPTNSIVNLFSAANATANTTKLSVTPGAYTFGAGTGPIVAEAVQTVDRSSTNGLCQAIMYGVPTDGVEYGADATTSIPSQSIWSKVPSVADLKRDPSAGIWVDTRLGSNGFTSYSDSNAIISRTTDGHGFTLFASADNDECGIVWNQSGFRIGTGGPRCAFECAIKATAVSAANGAFVGLASGIAATNFLNDTGDVPVNTRNYFGLSVPSGDPSGGDVMALESGNTQVTFDSNAVTLSTSLQKFGFLYNGTDVETYLDGTSIGDDVLAAEIAATNFPTGIYMSPAIWIKGGHTADWTFTVAWLRAVQYGY